MQDLTGKITGSTLTAAEWNQLPEEVQNVITAAGIALSSGDVNQLGKAVAAYSSAAEYFVDSGAADVYVVARTGAIHPWPSYVDGVAAVFKVGNTNTGASTINVSTLGVKSITNPDGSALIAGALVAGTYAKIRYVLASDRFELETGIISQVGASGYIVFPGGLIIQWGQASDNGAQSKSFNFPITFPTAVDRIIGSFSDISSGSTGEEIILFTVGGRTTSGASVDVKSVGVIGAWVVDYCAIGR